MKIEKDATNKLVLTEAITADDINKADDNVRLSVRFIFDDEPWDFEVKEKEIEATMKAAFKNQKDLKDLLGFTGPTPPSYVYKHGMSGALTSVMHDAVRVHKIIITEPISYKGCKTQEERDSRLEEIKQKFEDKLMGLKDHYYAEIAKKVNLSIIHTLSLMNGLN